MERRAPELLELLEAAERESQSYEEQVAAAYDAGRRDKRARLGYPR